MTQQRIVMKTIKQDELYTNLSGFLKTRGIELTEGTYAQNIKIGCNVLADTINFGQQSLHRAKVETKEKLDQMRKMIHEKTAPPQKPVPKSAKKSKSKAKKLKP